MFFRTPLGRRHSAAQPAEKQVGGLLNTPARPHPRWPLSPPSQGRLRKSYTVAAGRRRSNCFPGLTTARLQSSFLSPSGHQTHCSPSGS